MRKNKNKNTRSSSIPIVSTRAARDHNLVKIGDIARDYDLLPSTINFYTREGLLQEDARSIGGYRLYDRDRTIAKLKRIEKWQNDRLTIAEIKKLL